MTSKEWTKKYETSWDVLRENGQISPIAGLDAVSLGQVSEYFGTPVKNLQAARQKAKRDLEALGAFVATGREIEKRVAGAQRLDNFGFRLPLCDGGFTEVPGSRMTYFTAAAVMKLAEALGQKRTAESNTDKITADISITYSPLFEVKEVSFLGSELMAVRDNKGSVWAGVRWICEGIGLTKGQISNQRLKVQSDTVLSKGVKMLTLPTNGGEQEVLCLKLEFVPFWLSKISITPTMAIESPDIAKKLELYLTSVKDILAAAFQPFSGYRHHNNNPAKELETGRVNTKIYVFESDSKLVKIGVSAYPQQRKERLEMSSGFHICNEFIDGPYTNVFHLERIAKEHFRKYVTVGEWFSAPFQEIVAFVMEIIKTQAEYCYVERVSKFDTTKAFRADYLFNNYPQNVFINNEVLNSVGELVSKEIVRKDLTT